MKCSLPINGSSLENNFLATDAENIRSSLHAEFEGEISGLAVNFWFGHPQYRLENARLGLPAMVLRNLVDSTGALPPVHQRERSVSARSGRAVRAVQCPQRSAHLLRAPR